MLADVGGPEARGAARGAAGLAVLAAAALAIGGAALLAAPGQGIERAGDEACPTPVAAVTFPARPGRERMILPVGNRELAPVTATLCRYRPDGSLAAALSLDAARTARLAALFATPAGGWPSDALAAKTIVAMTDGELAARAAPSCVVAAATDVVTFRYGQGPDAAVLVRGVPCRDMSNGVITLRASEPVEQALRALGDPVPR